MITKARFGRTGHWSTRVIFGGESLREADEARASEVLDLLLAHGVNHIDTAPLYGASERLIGGWMRSHRGEFFLATKTLGRSYLEAMDDLARSLDRLQVEAVDLWQMHMLVDPAQWEEAMGPGGALDALIEAQASGMTRYIGVTGHGATAAAMHLRSLARHDFDSVLMPYNYPIMQVPAYAAEFEALARLCNERDVAVQTIKATARGAWGDAPRTRNTWYQPLEDPRAIADAVSWVLARPGVFLNAVGDVDLLPQVLAAAERFDPAVRVPEVEARLAALGLSPLLVR